MRGVKFRESSLVSETSREVNVRNTTQPIVSGTKMTHTHQNKNESLVEISSNSGFCSIYISKYGMNKEVGFGRKLLQILEDFQLHYEHIPTGIDALMLVLDENQLHQEVESELLQRIKMELSIDEVTIKRNLTLIMIVGEKLHLNIDNIARATKVLADERINTEIIHMKQGASQISLAFGVKTHDEKKALAALYNKFFTRSV